VEEIKKINGESLAENEKILPENDLGYIIWKLEALEDFLPCYKTMIEKE
jgi:hypothetical protein